MADFVVDVLRYAHPHAREAFRQLSSDLYRSYENRKTSSHFRPFEVFRSPIKQQELFDQRPVVTKAMPWQSAHQYGLAVDFVAFRGGRWSWSETEDWEFLRLRAEHYGLRRPMVWDKAHIEHPVWERVQMVLFGRS